MKKTLIALALTAGATFNALAQDIVDTAVKAGAHHQLHDLGVRVLAAFLDEGADGISGAGVQGVQQH